MEDWFDEEEPFSFETSDNIWDSFTEEDTNNEDKVMHDGGDFHLKSALRGLSDYLKNGIFKNEYLRMRSEYDISSSSMMTHIDVMLEFTNHFDLDVHDGLGRELVMNKLLDNKNDLIAEVVYSELCSYSTYIGNYYSPAYIRLILEDCYDKFDRLRKAEVFLMSIIILKNSIKNFVNQDVVGFSEYPSLEIMISEGYGKIKLSMGKNGTFILTTDIVIWEAAGRRVWFPMQYLLNASDKVSERLNVLMYSHIMSYVQVSGVPSLILVEKIIKIGDKVLNTMGNEGYDVLGNYEAIIVGVILSRDSEYLIEEPKTFLNNILGSIPTIVKHDIEDLVALLSGCREDELADVHGLYRIWGHPIVDIEGGLIKYRSVFKTDEDINDRTVKDTERKFKEIFVLSYHKKHGFFPPLRVDCKNKHKSYVVDMINNGYSVNTKHIGYCLDDWDFVGLLKAFEIPYSWNIIHSAKDKAVSPTRSELYESVSRTGSVFSTKNRRGILKMMSTPMLPLRNFLQHISTSGLPNDDLIIGVYPKERELKIKARLFSLMSYNLRQYFVSTEHLLGDKILPYFPQITMVVSLLDMMNKMGSMTKGMGDEEESVRYVINMDFIKWNLQMTYKLCSGVFKQVDKVFGVDNLIDNTHKLFSECVMFLCSGEGDFSPNSVTGVNIDGHYAWTGDGRGKEGLRQKGWTILTVCALMLVADKHDIEGELIGGGDNQVFSIKIRGVEKNFLGGITEESARYVRRKLTNFINDLAETLGELGLPLKTTETWVSHNLFMYNKHMYYKGVPMRSVLKSISRSFIFSNNSVMLLSNMIDSCNTIMKTAMMKEKVPMGILIMKAIKEVQAGIFSIHMHPSLFQLYGALKIKEARIARGGRGKKITIQHDAAAEESFLLRCMLLPSCLGGPGSVTAYSLIMRGFPDPVTDAFACLQSIVWNFEGRPTTLQAIHNMAGASGGTRLDYAKLVEDPTSINHDAPTHGMNEMRNLARDTLLKIKSDDNPLFFDLFMVLDRESERSFYTSLCSSDELDPKVLNEIAGASLYGYVGGLVSRVDQTKTIMRLSTTLDVVKLMCEAELRYISYLFGRDESPHDICDYTCSRIAADCIRTLSWKKKIHGVTVPHPYEYLSLHDVKIHSCDGDAVVIRCDRAVGDVLFSTMGSGKVYHGSYTKERFRQTDVAHAYGEEELLRKAINILKMINWRYKSGSRFADIVTYPLRAISNADPKKFVRGVEEVKGEFDHRRKVQGNVHGGIPNFLPSYTSHFSTSTSTWVSHSRGGKNENIHFQGVIIRGCFELLMRRWLQVTPSDNAYHLHESCKECILELSTPSEDKTCPIDPIHFPSLPGNPYVYMHEEHVMMDYSLTQVLKDDAAYQMVTEVENADLSVSVLTATMQLLLQIIGVGNMPESYLLLLRDKIPASLFFHHVCQLLKTASNVGIPQIFTLRNMEGVSVLFNSYSNLKWLYSKYEVTMDGQLEGGVHSSASLLNRLITKSGPYSGRKLFINLLLGGVPIQYLLFCYLYDGLLRWCIPCQNKIRAQYYSRKLSPNSAYHCKDHADVLIPRCEIISVHPELLIKGIDGFGLSIDIPLVTDVSTLVEVIDSELDSSTKKDNFPFLSLSDQGECCICLKEVIKSLLITNRNVEVSFISAGDLDDLGPCFQAMMEIQGSQSLLYVYPPNFSDKECRTMFDNHFVPNRLKGQVVMLDTSDKLTSLRNMIVLPGSIGMVPDLPISNVSGVISYLTELETAAEKVGYMFRAYLLSERVSPGGCAYLAICDRVNSSGYINKVLKEYDNKPLDLVLLNTQVIGKRMWCLPRPRDRNIGVVYSWMSWRSRFDLIRIIRILKKKMSSTGELIKKKVWVRRNKFLLQNFIATILAHCQDATLADISSITRITFNSITDSVLFKTSTESYNSRMVKAWRYYQDRCPLEARDVSYQVCKFGINLTTQRLEGFNCVGN